jgi:hypothetical protein
VGDHKKPYRLEDFTYLFVIFKGFNRKIPYFAQISRLAGRNINLRYSIIMIQRLLLNRIEGFLWLSG